MRSSLLRRMLLFSAIVAAIILYSNWQVIFLIRKSIFRTLFLSENQLVVTFHCFLLLFLYCNKNSLLVFVQKNVKQLIRKCNFFSSITNIGRATNQTIVLSQLM